MSNLNLLANHRNTRSQLDIYLDVVSPLPLKRPPFSAIFWLAWHMPRLFPAEVLIPTLDAGSPRLRHIPRLSVPPLSSVTLYTDRTMKIPMRPIGAGLRKPVYQRYSFGQRRTFLSEPQRRKATTASGSSLSFPLIDHHYEYFFQWYRRSGKRKTNKHSAIVVGAGGAGLRAAVGLAESGLDIACISKLVCFSQLLNPHIIFTDWHPL